MGTDIGHSGRSGGKGDKMVVSPVEDLDFLRAAARPRAGWIFLRKTRDGVPGRVAAQRGDNRLAPILEIQKVGRVTLVKLDQTAADPLAVRVVSDTFLGSVRVAVDQLG